MVVKTMIKRPELLIVETLKEWDRHRERRTKSQREPIKVELEGLNITTLVGPQLIETETVEMVRLL